MSISSPSTSSSSTSGYNMSSLSGSSSIQITGLASGLNTNQIIQEEMALYQQPVTNLQNEQNGITAQNKALTSIQTELQTLESDAQALSDPSLFANTQSVSSTDPSLISATASSGQGAVEGGYQVQVNAMASSAQRTFTVSGSALSADTVTIDGQSVTLQSGATVSDLANAVNGNSKMDVWATVNSSGNLVLSDRSTGQQTGSYIQVSDTGSALTEQTTLANAGQNASLSVTSGSTTTTVTSASNTVTNAIAGVALTLSGVTPASSPVTINVGAPAPSTSNISTALNTFITQYNKVIGDVQTQLSTPPSSSDPTVGTLYGDPELQDLLSSMRQSMYTTFNNSSSSIHSMLDIGVSTGATTGSGAVSQTALTGDLQLNSTTLTSALQTDPLGTQQMMVAWGASFSTLVGATADPGGTIDTRVQGDDAQISQLGNQITAMQAALADKQNFLVQQFAQLEAALSSSQSTSSWLTSQIAQLP
jgi:flagellar hook-associated protein 2